MQILIALIVFGVLIFIHELGHFIAAKSMGVKVHEFAIGMGPTILKYQKKETKYALRLFPVGGFVSMEGEETSSDDPRAFNRKPVWKRLIVICAGAIMNVLLGFAILLVITSQQNLLATNKIAKFDDNAVSQSSGLQVGDEIIRINGSGTRFYKDVMYAVLRDEDGKVPMTVIRDGKMVTLPEVTFQTTVQDGVQMVQQDFYFYGVKPNVGNVIRQSWFETMSNVKLVFYTIFDLIRGRYGLNQLSGPVGTVGAIGSAASYGFDYLLSLTAFITINLGVFNLLPLPALDGGRLLFLLVEAVRHKPIKPEYENYVHLAGFALLLLLMLVVTYNDIVKLFRG